MAEPGKGQPEGLDKQKIKQILVPAIAVAAIVVLVGLVVYVSDAAAPKKMSDGSNGSVDDPDLKDLAEGVKYRDVKVGIGEECPRGAEVKMHYTGWLPDGTVFDSSKEGKPAGAQPADFQLNSLIPGWQSGIPGMKAGGIRKLVIQPSQGYGSVATGKIPANSTLIFEVELLSFEPPPPARDLTKLSDGTAPGADDPNLKELEGGLKYRDIKEGTGAPVLPGASVTMHYTGWLLDGEVFDSSWKRGRPAPFELPKLIPGWQKGIPGMRPGGIRKLVVPPELGYGSKGQGRIPGGATLVFEVELVK